MPDRMKREELRWVRLMELGRRTGCHQRPDRSFFFRGWQFPVCARCTGVFAGYLAAIGLYFVYHPTVWPVLGGAAVLFVDWFLQYRNWVASNNRRRFLTGICGGYAVMSVYLTALVWIWTQLKIWIGG